jgi:formaldehyde-activating enzyme involved in methanogenesis
MTHKNNRGATRQALELGRRRQPALDELLAVADTPANPFFGVTFG